MQRSDGYYHLKITLYLVPVAALAGAILFAALDLDPLVGALLGAIGDLCGGIIEPDWDQTMITSSEWRVIKKLTVVPVLGHLAAGVWVGITGAYAMLFGYMGTMFPKGSLPRKWFTHRGISHWPIVGTLSRLAYLALPAMAAMYLLGLKPALLLRWDLVALVVGLCISDIGHAWRDFVAPKVNLLGRTPARKRL